MAGQVCEWVFDSLGRVLEERQNGRAVSSQYTGDGKRHQVTYPGGRVISRTFDALDRIVAIRDGVGAGAQTIQESAWIGPGMRELRRLNGNGTRLTFLNASETASVGYDAVQRLVRLRVLGPGGAGAAAIVDREYAYNRASQRTLERRHDDFGLTDHYAYDSVYRIVAATFDRDGGVGAVPRDLAGISYRYDGVGNRRDVEKETVAAGVTAQSYSVNALNQYTAIATGAGAPVARGHDANGNLLGDGTRTYLWDAKNRLVAASRASDGAPLATYGYLADGRRARKTVYRLPEQAGGTPGVVERVSVSLWDGAQEVEEQDGGTGASTVTYVWSPVYVDELVQVERTAAHALGAGVVYAHQDARCNVVALTDAAGAVVERRRFDDFGNVEVRGPAGEVLGAAGGVGVEYGFQGRKLDHETGLVYFRARYYAPEEGRFLSRDPVWDAGNAGGAYTFVGNGPGSGRDPGGEQREEIAPRPGETLAHLQERGDRHFSNVPDEGQSSTSWGRERELRAQKAALAEYQTGMPGLVPPEKAALAAGAVLAVPLAAAAAPAAAKAAAGTKLVTAGASAVGAVAMNAVRSAVLAAALRVAPYLATATGTGAVPASLALGRTSTSSNPTLLRSFAQQTGSSWWGDLWRRTQGSHPPEGWRTWSKNLIDRVLGNGGRVNFNLSELAPGATTREQMKSAIDMILKNRGAFADRVTSHELRHLQSVFCRFGDKIRFYLDGKEVPPPWTW